LCCVHRSGFGSNPAQCQSLATTDAFGRATKMTTTAFNAGTTIISYGGGQRIITPPVGAVITETFNGRGLVSKRQRGDITSTMNYLVVVMSAGNTILRVNFYLRRRKILSLNLCQRMK
jgi:hypothetical protein